MVIVVAIVLALFLAVPTQAVEYPVTPGPEDSAVNLRQAIMNSNTNPGPDTIRVAACIDTSTCSERSEMLT